MGGQAGIPNGYRFGYLSDVASVAVAFGILLIVSGRTASARRPIAFAALGALAVSGALGARDALAVWPERRETFDAFHGQDTLLGRAAARWEAFGRVVVEPGIEHSRITVEAVRKYRLDPDFSASPSFRSNLPAEEAPSFRVTAPRSAPRAGEKVVEWVRDGWGRDWGIVLAAPRPPRARA